MVGVEITVLPVVVFRSVDGDQVIGDAVLPVIVITGFDAAVKVAITTLQSVTVAPTCCVFCDATVKVCTVVVVETVCSLVQTVTSTLDVPSQLKGVWNVCVFKPNTGVKNVPGYV